MKIKLLVIAILVVVVLSAIGRPKDSPMFEIRINPTTVKDGWSRLAGSGSSKGKKEKYTSADADADLYAQGSEPNTSFGDFTDVNFAPVNPRVDVFDTSVIGHDVASERHTKAFETDVNNRMLQLKLGRPAATRAMLAEDPLRWTAGPDGFKGTRVIQSNPFVKVPIINPSAHGGGIGESRAL